MKNVDSIDFERRDKASTFHLPDRCAFTLRESREILSFGQWSKWYGRNLHFNAYNIFRVSREVFSTSFHSCFILYLFWNIAIRDVSIKKIKQIINSVLYHAHNARIMSWTVLQLRWYRSMSENTLRLIKIIIRVSCN